MAQKLAQTCSTAWDREGAPLQRCGRTRLFLLCSLLITEITSVSGLFQQVRDLSESRCPELMLLALLQHVHGCLSVSCRGGQGEAPHTHGRKVGMSTICIPDRGHPSSPSIPDAPTLASALSKLHGSVARRAHRVKIPKAPGDLFLPWPPHGSVQ